MNTNVLFIGLEVDDNAFHAAIVDQAGELIEEMKCKPVAGVLKKKLTPFIEAGSEIRICYEATYLGFSICRQLKALGLQCEVIASTLIPQVSGPRVKTDRLDCIHLAKLYRNGLLTPVHLPDQQEETIRDLNRSRFFLTRQSCSLKRHILMACRRMGHDYRANKGKTASHWTNMHMIWLEGVVANSEQHAFKINLEYLLMTLRQMQSQIAAYDNEIARIAEGPQYKRAVKALSCFRGLDTRSAMSVITEIGDVRRFPHPRKMASYAGMDVAEYSSGGKERRFQITKMGNAMLRTTIVEAAQFASKHPRFSRNLIERRKGVDPRFIEIADRCMHRLYKKSQALSRKGKHTNKVKVACAREMLGFIWESLNLAAA